LVIDPGEEFRGDPGAALYRANLRMLHGACEREFGRRRRIGTRFPSDTDRDGGPSLRVFGVVRPRISGAFTDYVCGFQRDRWITNPVKTLRALLANAQAP
jgi:hypothetical protein